MPVRLRLALLVALTAAVLVSVGGLIFIQRLQVSLDDSLDATLRVRADALIERIGQDGNSEFQDAGKAGLLPPNQAVAQVINGQGLVSESSEGARTKSLLTAEQVSEARRAAFSLTVDQGVDSSLRLLAVPVPGTGQPPVVVIVGTTRNLQVEAVTRLRTAVWIGGTTVVAVSALGAWLLARAVLRPAERMRRQADRITAGNAEARLPVPRTHDEAKPHPDAAILEITDQGPGFPPAFLPHAFKRFRRADPSRSPEGGGAGLGLAIVASLVQAHGWTVTADNTISGARVRIELTTAHPEPFVGG